MSVSNPENFDYLKVSEFIPGDDNNKPHYGDQMPIVCLNRSSVKEQYSANSTDNISFDVINDGSDSFKALHEGSLIIAGEQLYEVTNYTKKVTGASSASISADQVANAELSRFVQHIPMANSDTKTVIWSLNDLLKWFQQKNDITPFKFVPQGFFPKRAIKVTTSMDGKTLLQTITKTWPGTVCRPWGYTIYVYGYKQQRDKNGDLVQFMDTDTNLRFDAMRDAKEITVTRDFSKICNAVEVKAATYNMANNVKTDNQTNSVTTKPFFKSFIVKSGSSIKKYGLYMASEPITDVVKPESGVSSARERMVTAPQVSLTAVIDTPGETGEQPLIGYKYTLGLSALDNEVFHVRLLGYTWYPFDSTKGTTIQLNSVDPGVIGSLSTMIVHDAELSPSATEFKAIEAAQDDATGDNDQDDDNTGDEQGDVDSDDSTDRADDAAEAEGDDGQQHDGTKVGKQHLPGAAPTGGAGGGSGKTPSGPNTPSGSGPSNNGEQFNGNAYLPIFDKAEKDANISTLGNITVNHGNPFEIRETENLQGLDNGSWKPSLEDNKDWRHVMRLDYGRWYWESAGSGEWTNFYDAVDAYLGLTTITASGMIAAPQNFTFRSGVTNDDYDKDGNIRHYNYPTDHGTTNTYEDWRTHKNGKRVNPGQLAQITMGELQARKGIFWPLEEHVKVPYGYGPGDVRCKRIIYNVNYHYSNLSQKRSIVPVKPENALNRIKNTDIVNYRYKETHNGNNQEWNAGPIIDDIHKNKKFNVSKKYIARGGGGVKPDVMLADTMAAVKYLDKKDKDQQQKIDKQQQEIDDLKQQIKEIKDQLKK